MKGVSMDELVIYPSKFKTVLIAAGALIFVCIILAFAIWEEKSEVPFWEDLLIYWVGTPLFGFAFIYACYRLIVPKPAVIINHRGIFDNASALSAGLVEWGEIDKVFIYEYYGQRCLGIVPLDVKAFLKRQPVFKRWLMKINMHLVEAPINIPQNTLPIKVDELVLKILEYIRNHGGSVEEHEDS
jgi:hypothetical protein